ncbi:hypothetical protein [Streptomyces sp. NPDC058985]|uniref:hypothetical protein n=1 Tax=Streptomyces sp. NPDC058985 TaxID=3346684 RepID=UPI0036A1F2B6
MLTGLMLCAHMWSPEGRPSPFGRWDAWDDRLDILIPFDREKQDYVGFSTSKLFAAVYPEAVALAPLIASPYWRRLADGTEAEQARFFEEIASRVTYPYLPPNRTGDAIAHWALADSWRPFSRPLTTYTPGRVRGTLPGIAANRLARHEKSALWFSRLRRNQGRTLLFHGHLKPVLLRDGEPQYVKWEGTIWHSTRTDDQMKEQVSKRRRALEGAGPPAAPAPARFKAERDTAGPRARTYSFIAQLDRRRHCDDEQVRTLRGAAALEGDARVLLAGLMPWVRPRCRTGALRGRRGRRRRP